MQHSIHSGVVLCVEIDYRASIMKRRLITIVLILGLILIGLLWHGLQKKAVHKRQARTGATSVVLARASLKTLPITLGSVGTLQAKKSINVSAPFAAFVVAVNYQPGSYVKAGTALIQLDNRNEQAKLFSDKADLHLKKLQYSREKWAFGKGAVARADVDLAYANYQEARATLSADQTMFDQTTIRATFSAYVGAKTINVGDYVQTGAVLTTLTDRRDLLLNYSFPERYATQLKLGQNVLATVDSQAGKTYTGRVSYISPTVDPTTHSVALQADIPNPDNSLSPGLLLRIQQNLGEIKGAIVVPEEAIVPTITGSKVYVVRDHKAYSVPVETGASYGADVQITKGLKAGDRVIVRGQSEVHNGSIVREVH